MKHFFIFFLLLECLLFVHGLSAADEDSYNRAVGYYLKGDLENAAVLLDKVVTLEPQNTPANKLFIGVLEELGTKYVKDRNFEALASITRRLEPLDREIAEELKSRIPSALASEEKPPLKTAASAYTQPPKREPSEAEEKEKIKKDISHEKKTDHPELSVPARKSATETISLPVKKETGKPEKQESVQIVRHLYTEKNRMTFFLLTGAGGFFAVLLSIIFFYTFSHSRNIIREQIKMLNNFERKHGGKEDYMKKEITSLQKKLEEARKTREEKKQNEIAVMRIQTETERKNNLEGKLRNLGERAAEETRISRMVEQNMPSQNAAVSPLPPKEIFDIFAVRRVNIPLSHEELKRMVQSENINTRLHALWALGEKGGEEAAEILLEDTRNLSSEEKREGLKALKKILDYETPPPNLRESIIRTLAGEKKKGWII
ncbi:MAG TPA: hypothetical protein VJC03_08250 [bacterium]|nr:hypothetical protein [bacterium]